jgi:hypothetical protein
MALHDHWRLQMQDGQHLGTLFAQVETRTWRLEQHPNQLQAVAGDGLRHAVSSQPAGIADTNLRRAGRRVDHGFQPYWATRLAVLGGI